MFGLGSTGAATAAAEAVTLLKVIELASDPKATREVIEDLRRQEAAIIVATEATQRMLADIERRERALQEALQGALDDRAEAERVLAEAHTTASEKLAHATQVEADAARAHQAAVEAEEDARARAAAIEGMQRRVAVDVFEADAKVAVAKGEFEELTSKKARLEAECEDLELRVTIAREAIGKLLGA